jgi:hypothetical protein
MAGIPTNDRRGPTGGEESREARIADSSHFGVIRRGKSRKSRYVPVTFGPGRRFFGGRRGGKLAAWRASASLRHNGGAVGQRKFEPRLRQAQDTPFDRLRTSGPSTGSGHALRQAQDERRAAIRDRCSRRRLRPSRPPRPRRDPARAGRCAAHSRSRLRRWSCRPHRTR